MVKVDIVRSIQLATGLNYEEVEEMITQTVEIMKESLEDGESVLVTGLGKFEVRDKRARPGRDPKSKKPYEISEGGWLLSIPQRSGERKLTWVIDRRSLLSSSYHLQSLIRSRLASQNFLLFARHQETLL